MIITVLRMSIVTSCVCSGICFPVTRINLLTSFPALLWSYRYSLAQSLIVIIASQRATVSGTSHPDSGSCRSAVDGVKGLHRGNSEILTPLPMPLVSSRSPPPLLSPIWRTPHLEDSADGVHPICRFLSPFLQMGSPLRQMIRRWVVKNGLDCVIRTAA